MRILMVSPYPPIRDGIATYAVQEVAALLDAATTSRCSRRGRRPRTTTSRCAARAGPLALAKRVRRYDRVIIQYHPDVFYPLPLDDRDGSS